jgi:putative drug exporter of the RND superfamily
MNQPMRPRRHDASLPENTTRSAMSRLARTIIRHRRLVMICWLVALLAGGFASGRVSDRLTYDWALPGQPGYQTAQKVLTTFGNGGNSTPILLTVSAPPGESLTGQMPQVDAAFSQLRHQLPQLRVVDYGVTGSKVFVAADGSVAYALVFEPAVQDLGTEHTVTNLGNQAEASVARALPGDRVGLTGLSQLESGGSSNGPGVLAETLIGAVGALVVLAFVFASFLAFIPLVVAAVSILTTLLIVLGLSYLTQVSFIVEFLAALVGLGVAIDYSLLLVTRWREERARGVANHDAVVRAVETAGRSIVISGLTVAVGLVALVVLPVPALRSTGIGGMLIPLISILVVNTLLPALLAGIGPRIDWPRIRKEGQASRAWSGWARMVTRYRIPAALVALGVLVVLALPVFGIKLGETSVSAFSQTGSARVAYNALADGGIPGGALTPVEVLTTAQAAPTTVTALRNLPGVSAAVLPAGSSGTRGDLSDIIAIPGQPTVNNTTLAPVRAIQARVKNTPGVIGVTGEGPIEQDFNHAVFGNFPLMFAIIAMLTFLLLARAFRSAVLAGKAVLLNLLSLAATFGLLTWFWQEGHGSSALFGIPATGAITFWLPLMIFAFLFGLSMDYEVFILTRVREEYDRGGNTSRAVVEGLARTGRLVTCAALILFLAFASLASDPDTDIKVLATGLGAGILLDATVIRAFLVPALIALLGQWNWWTPRPLRRGGYIDDGQDVAQGTPLTCPGERGPVRPPSGPRGSA